jgi:NAD(P)-dependent dehydrogenase (short-subunit alcohol dehydrogenase family)
MSNFKDFERLNALITGGASGMGTAVAEELPERGARVAGRLLDRADAPAAVDCLARPAAAAVTGTALAVGGGMQGLRLRSTAKQA